MATTVPLIDIAPYRNGGADDRQRVAAAIDAACREIGFLVVEGHGVDPELIAEMHRVSHAYFARPFWEKMRFKMPPDRATMSPLKITKHRTVDATIQPDGS